MILRKLLTCAVGMGALAGALEVLAQEEVVVTGTRIEQPDFVFSNPVVSIDSETFLASGKTNLTSYLTEFPALTGSLDSFDSGGSSAFVGGAGLNLLNLRNLGYDRTLVLVNGRRHVATFSESAAVDVNMIPIELIERVDIMTGGASAVYGADGVTGVVNFVLRDDFEGLIVRAQGGDPADPGAGNRLLALTFGRNFDGGRGNVTVTAEHSADEELYGYDRDFNGSRPGILSTFLRNPDDDSAEPPLGDADADDPNVPDEVPFDRAGFGDTSRCGGIYTVGANGPSPDFNCDGSPWDFGPLPPQTDEFGQTFPILPFYQVGGDATLLDDYVGLSTVLPEIERSAVNLHVSYDFSDSAQFFSEIKYVKSDAFNLSEPTFDFFLVLEPDNPFVPAALQDEPLAEGFYFMSRDHFDLGVRGDDIERETQRSVVGVSGDMPWASYEVSLTYGKSEVVARQLNNRFNDRFFAALDAVDNGGTPDCRVNVDPAATPFDFPDPVTYDPADGNCVPLNLFGDGVASQEAIDWVMQTTTATDELEQTVLSGYLTGEAASISLPGGPMGWAFGGEYREESSRSRPDPFDTAGATFGNVIQPNYGEFDVSEVFGEVNLPLLSGARLADELSVDLAYRYSDYSTIGNAGTWKIGTMWAPIPAITFRATVAEAVRAPNIGELFAAENQTFAFITDPCDINELDGGTQYREVNCTSILSDLGVDPGTFTDPNSSNIPGVQSGNPSLTEETAETNTFGVILRPRFAENLTVALDYYDIELTDAISLISAEELAERCVDAPTLANQFCPLIERDPADGGISSFTRSGVNIAAFETAGVDVTFEYLLDPAALGADRDWGVFNFRFVGNKLHALEFLPSPGGVIDDDVGEGPGASFAAEAVPQWQGTFDLMWNRGPLSVNYGFQWFDETQRISNANLANEPDSIGPEHYYFDAKWSHDVFLRYDMSNAFSVYGGVNNVTDERPAFDQISHPVSPVGRTYYLGLRARIE